MSESLSLADLRARCVVPEDLTVDIRNGVVSLSSNGRTVDIPYGQGWKGVFRDGPLSWDDLCMRYLLPALERLRQ